MALVRTWRGRPRPAGAGRPDASWLAHSQIPLATAHAGQAKRASGRTFPRHVSWCAKAKCVGNGLSGGATNSGATTTTCGSSLHSSPISPPNTLTRSLGPLGCRPFPALIMTNGNNSSSGCTNRLAGCLARCHTGCHGFTSREIEALDLVVDQERR